MFDDISKLDECYMNCKSLGNQLESSLQDLFIKEDLLNKLQKKVNSLQIRNQELLDVVKKLISILDEVNDHA